MPGRGSVGGALRRVAGAWLAAWLAAALAVQAHAQETAAADTQPAFEQILVAGEYRYARSRRAGVHVSFDQGHTWQARSTGLPHRVVYPFPDPPEFATVTSLAADPANPRRLAATTASAVFVSSNGAMAWQPVAIEQVHPHAYFTSVALSPHDPAGMLLGTSFHGVYETTDGGAHWHHLTPAIRFLTERNLFYEEVAGLSYDPAAPRAMVVLAGFDGGVFYVSNRFGEERRSGTGLLRYPVPAMATIQIGYAATGDGWELHAGTVDARWRLTADGTWSPIGAATPLRRGVPLQLPAPAPEPAPVAIEAGPAAEPPPETARPTPANPAPRRPRPTLANRHRQPPPPAHRGNRRPRRARPRQRRRPPRRPRRRRPAATPARRRRTPARPSCRSSLPACRRRRRPAPPPARHLPGRTRRSPPPPARVPRTRHPRPSPALRRRNRRLRPANPGGFPAPAASARRRRSGGRRCATASTCDRTARRWHYPSISNCSTGTASTRWSSTSRPTSAASATTPTCRWRGRWAPRRAPSSWTG